MDQGFRGLPKPDVITDQEHGNRGRGSLHADATGSASGFMSASQVTQLLSLPPSIIQATAAIDFNNLPNILGSHDSFEDQTISVFGAATGDVAIASPDTTIEAGLVWSAWVSASDTVTIRLANIGKVDVDPVSVTWRAIVIKH